MNRFYWLFFVVAAASTPPIFRYLKLTDALTIANVGFFMTPFRHAKEIVPTDSKPQHRTQVGCQTADSLFVWIDFSSSVVSQIRGSHHRKIRLYSILSGYIDDRKSTRSEKLLKEHVCIPSAFSRELGCSEKTQLVGVKNYTLFGKLERERTWHCEPQD